MKRIACLVRSGAFWPEVLVLMVQAACKWWWVVDKNWSDASELTALFGLPNQATCDNRVILFFCHIHSVFPAILWTTNPAVLDGIILQVTLIFVSVHCALAGQLLCGWWPKHQHELVPTYGRAPDLSLRLPSWIPLKIFVLNSQSLRYQSIIF